MKLLLSILILFLFNLLTSYSQELYVPISDPYIVKLYKYGKKDSLGNYTSKDSLGNTIISGKFDGTLPIEKWKVFFDNGRERALYSYKDGELNGKFVEYYWNGNIKMRGSFLNNKPSYPDVPLMKQGATHPRPVLN